ncbi:MAG: hypothetical protein CO171_04810 [Syntrophobacterales bacterium CG_4_9_14_3_um_filter_49_8]|nr:MAG: hypothetical protein COX52_12335 [Syntrophobacterales bacterium CG23_combo_of_CG06-09_8_20_14_all_48_27]PJA49625.1 MAG: hypothetical protein CO171_04810 [Syntrophobacterales bacterium CG_4_9_14_3_um_filter_49_8]
MKSYMKTLIVSFTLLFAVGCGLTTPNVMMTTSKQFPPTNPDAVKIYLTDKPTKSFEEIGRISINKYSTGGAMVGVSRSSNEIYKNLREKAASIGGDAIINVTEDMMTTYGVVIKMSP